jgi:hypothetical protein
MLTGHERDALAVEEGRNFLRTHAVMAWVLYDWHAGGNGGRPLHGVAFDKLGSSTLRVWENLADQRVASFHFPYRLRYGLHGKGPAVESVKDDQVCYLGEIIIHVDGLHLGTNRWFAVEPSRTYDVSLFSPGMTPLMMDEWREGRMCPLDDERDRLLVQTWAQAISAIDHREIRALGTHCSVRDTLEDIIAFELVRWGSGLRKALRVELGKAPAELRKALRYADEIVRKSEKNAVRYAAAWQKLDGALQSASSAHSAHSAHAALLLSAFRSTHQPASMIWDDARVIACAVPAAVSAAHERYLQSHLPGLPKLGSPGELLTDDSGWTSACATLKEIADAVVGRFPSL